MAPIFGSTSDPNRQTPSLLWLLQEERGRLRRLATKDGVRSRILALPFVNLQKQAAAEIKSIKDIKGLVGAREQIRNAWVDMAEAVRRLRQRLRRRSLRLKLFNLIYAVKRSKTERLGSKICRLMKFAAKIAKKRIGRANRMVLSHEKDLNILALAKNHYGFNGELFFSKKLEVFDARQMIVSAMSLYGFTVEQLRVSAQLGITITPAGAIIEL